MEFVLHTHILHARTLIAFYPSEGFAIVEGYTRSLNNLPVVSNLHVGDSYYTIEITRVDRKDLQDNPASFVQCDCPPNEDCECNIVFFPTYILILEFRVLHASVNGRRYCIDGRFPSPQDLLARYKSLLDLPNDMSFTNDHREEDMEFYIEYYRLLEKDENIHRVEGV
jgi:hypothetical protein